MKFLPLYCVTVQKSSRPATQELTASSHQTAVPPWLYVPVEEELAILTLSTHFYGVLKMLTNTGKGGWAAVGPRYASTIALIPIGCENVRVFALRLADKELLCLRCPAPNSQFNVKAFIAFL